MKWVTIAVPATVKREQIELMVDPAGWNITAASAEALKEKANQLLSAPHAKKFSLLDTDRVFFDLLVAIRNYLSHRSAGALGILRGRLLDLQRSDPSSVLNGNMTTIGSYLKTKPHGGSDDRAKLIGRAVITLSSKMV